MEIYEKLKKTEPMKSVFFALSVIDTLYHKAQCENEEWESRRYMNEAVYGKRN